MIITRHLCCRLQRQISYGLDVNSQMDALNRLKLKRVYADSCGLKTAFLGNGGRNAATILSLRYSLSR